MFIKPMLASPALPPFHWSDDYAYEPKYDGLRAVIDASPAGVVIYARSGANKTGNFPDVAEAVGRLVTDPLTGEQRSFLVDGEIIAVNEQGQHVSFQRLQSRMHVTKNVDLRVLGQPAQFRAFDILQLDDRSFANELFANRRIALNSLIANGNEGVQLGRVAVGSLAGEALYQEAQAEGWEGLIAKRLLSRYHPNRRCSDWVKIKFVVRQEFVVGGWTEPRRSRGFIGSLILGIYEGGKLVHCGNAGTGFTNAELKKVHGILSAIETTDCPFADKPKQDEIPHWVTPSLMAEVKYCETTEDNKLRFPVYLGLRDDKDPTEVRWEHKPAFWR